MPQIEWYLVENANSVSVLGADEFHDDDEAGYHGSSSSNREEESKGCEHVPVHGIGRCYTRNELKEHSRKEWKATSISIIINKIVLV